MYLYTRRFSTAPQRCIRFWDVTKPMRWVLLNTPFLTVYLKMRFQNMNVELPFTQSACQAPSQRLVSNCKKANLLLFVVFVRSKRCVKWETFRNESAVPEEVPRSKLLSSQLLTEDLPMYSKGPSQHANHQA